MNYYQGPDVSPEYTLINGTFWAKAQPITSPLARKMIGPPCFSLEILGWGESNILFRDLSKENQEILIEAYKNKLSS